MSSKYLTITSERKKAQKRILCYFKSAVCIMCNGAIQCSLHVCTDPPITSMLMDIMGDINSDIIDPKDETLLINVMIL